MESTVTIPLTRFEQLQTASKILKEIQDDSTRFIIYSSFERTWYVSLSRNEVLEKMKQEIDFLQGRLDALRKERDGVVKKWWQIWK